MDELIVSAPPAVEARVEDRQGVIAEEDTGPLYWMLRIACAAEFIGHGAFGIITKADWVPYFGVVGIPPELAWKLMPLIGTVDITLGLVVGFVRPFRIVLLYMTIWGFWTATLRPLASEPIWEFIERVPNWAIRSEEHTSELQ